MNKQELEKAISFLELEIAHWAEDIMINDEHPSSRTSPLCIEYQRCQGCPVFADNIALGLPEGGCIDTPAELYRNIRALPDSTAENIGMAVLEEIKYLRDVQHTLLIKLFQSSG